MKRHPRFSYDRRVSYDKRMGYGRHVNPLGKRRQRGVTLVELMIAMLLGLILTAGVVQIFIGNRTTYAFSEGLSWIQENARFAVDHMADHTRMAGHSGCVAGAAVFNNLDGTNDFRDDLEAGLQGHDYDETEFSAAAVNPALAGTAGDWEPALPDELGNPLAVLPGSDVLVVRYVSGRSEPLVAPFSVSAHLFVESEGDLEIGDILIATDCQKASIFQLTNVVDTGGSATSRNLVHSNGSTVEPGNTIANWGTQQSYGLGAEVARLETVAFYVGRGGSGAPALFQARLAGADGGFEHEELIEGVDTMQLRYGVDSDGDRQVDAWQTAGAVGDWTAVLAVEVTLLARADEEYGTEADSAVYDIGGMEFDPVDDRRLRQVFTTTIGLRNRLP